MPSYRRTYLICTNTGACPFALVEQYERLERIDIKPITPVRERLAQELEEPPQIAWVDGGGEDFEEEALPDTCECGALLEERRDVVTR